MLQKLSAVCAKENILCEEPMAKHTTFKTGGNAEFFVLPQNKQQLCEILQIAHAAGQNALVIGNGSNLLVADSGIRGIVISTQNLKNIQVQDNTITAECGASMAALSAVAKSHGLTGLEFASGIPGTVGGGIVMNAGAYGGQLSDCAVQTDCASQNGRLHTFVGEEQMFGYRKSAFSTGDWIVLETKFALQTGEPNEIENTMRILNQRRKEKQPLELPSAGSTFKRPDGYFAGKLIEDAGLKGYRFGGACVSQKHAGFVVNDQNATSADVLQVIRHCQKTVLEKFGIELQPEVRFIGNFDL